MTRYVAILMVGCLVAGVTSVSVFSEDFVIIHNAIPGVTWQVTSSLRIEI